MSVGINVSYWIHGDKTEVSSKTFNGNSVEEARIGLPVGSVPTKVSLHWSKQPKTTCIIFKILRVPYISSLSAECWWFQLLVRLSFLTEVSLSLPYPNTLFFQRSGLHDQGELPPLKEHGSLCKLLSCVKQAKEFNDVFLTTKLQTSNKSESIGSDSNPSKRPKI